jgi:hypothetical protein
MVTSRLISKNAEEKNYETIIFPVALYGWNNTLEKSISKKDTALSNLGYYRPTTSNFLIYTRNSTVRLVKQEEARRNRGCGYDSGQTEESRCNTDWLFN